MLAYDVAFSSFTAQTCRIGADITREKSFISEMSCARVSEGVHACALAQVLCVAGLRRWHS